MRQKLLALLLAAVMALPAAGCGETSMIGVTGVADSPAESFTWPEDPQQDGGDLVVLPVAPEGTQSGGSALPGDTGQEEGPLYSPAEEDPAPDEDGTYNSAEDVALYLDYYGHLPDNYITKDEARNLGWTGGSVEQVAPGCAIGGDRFGNREGILPAAQGRTYYECDIDTLGRSSRGAKRLVFSDDGLIYYTEDHYETFTLLYGEE